MLYLVRHAHAGNKAKWNGSDVARPLSAQGHKEALGLIEQLRAHPMGRVLSSPAERCLQTVQPLAGRHRQRRPHGGTSEPLGPTGPAGQGRPAISAAVLDLLVLPGTS